MKRIPALVIAAILFTGCTVAPEKAPVQAVEKSTKPEPKIVLQDELLNEPPANPRFVIAKASASDAPDQAIAESIKQQLQGLGYVEAASRDDANVVIWYSYDSQQTGLRQVGQASDVWGEQLEQLAVSDPNTIMPVSFKVQIISVQESNFPGQVIPVWQGEWSSTVPTVNMVEFSNGSLAEVFAQYQSEETQSEIAAFRQARERKMERAMNTYMAMVMYRIQKHWQKPRINIKGKTCKVKIVQSMVGEIRSHELLTCDKNRRFRRSIEKAIKDASPLPMPKEELFDRRELILIFQG